MCIRDSGIAHVFAQSGFSVNLIDVNAAQLEKALQTIAKNLDRQVAKGTLTCLLYTSPSPRDRTRSRMPSSA